MEHLRGTLERLGIELTEKQADAFKAYRAEILKWNESVNLTAITDLDEFEQKHFSDSAVAARLPQFQTAKRIIDVGTGGGFPGVPLAILFPEKEFVLLDSLKKRLTIVDETCKKIGIENVTVLHGRAEDIGQLLAYRETFDLCVSRAVANLRVLSELCLPFVRTGGLFVAYKTETAKAEAEEARKAIAILGGKLAAIEPALTSEDDGHRLLLIAKESATPKKYPRKAGTPAKNPL